MLVVLLLLLSLSLSAAADAPLPSQLKECFACVAYSNKVPNLDNTASLATLIIDVGFLALMMVWLQWCHSALATSNTAGTCVASNETCSDK